LDTTHLRKEQLTARFPMIYQALTSIGLEIHKDWIPVVPAQHYSCGGVKTDLDGRTSIPGLYAAGEVACTGIHGGNRLASNSLLEALVFGRSAAEACTHEPAYKGPDPKAEQPKCVPEAQAIRIRHGLQRTMTDYVSIVRTDAGLATALKQVKALIKDFESQPAAPFSTYSVETKNLLLTGLKVVEGAAARKENIGLHYNTDLAPNGDPQNSAEAPRPAATPKPKKER
jgi:L-aspartate oxidase